MLRSMQPQSRALTAKESFVHFFYMDESGCTGANLLDANQFIFVLGGISVADQKWNNTHTVVAQ